MIQLLPGKMSTRPILSSYPMYVSDDEDNDEDYSPLTSLTSSSTWWSINSSQYNDLMERIHELETGKEGGTHHSLRTITTCTSVSKGITLRSVLGHRQEYLTDEQASSAQSIPWILTAMSASTDHKDIIKSQPPPTFELSDDVRIWILWMNDYFILWQITDPVAQATCACMYLNETLVKRTSWLQLTGNSKAFQNWEKLQAWLLTNYTSANPELDATLELDRVTMRQNEPIQAFINHFETVVTDLEWNEPTVCAVFQKKLSLEVLDAVHLLSPAGYPKSFGQFKSLAQWAEDFIKIGKRSQADKDKDSHYSPQKKTRFTEDYKNPGNRESSRKPMTEWSHNKWSTQPPHQETLTYDERRVAEERRHWREMKACVNCGSMDHWAAKCTWPDKRLQAKKE